MQWPVSLHFRAERTSRERLLGTSGHVRHRST